MATVEVRLSDAEAPAVLQDMRVWLDRQRIAPSRFTCSQAGQYLVVITEFQADTDAEAFADRFAGRMR